MLINANWGQWWWWWGGGGGGNNNLKQKKPNLKTKKSCWSLFYFWIFKQCSNWSSTFFKVWIKLHNTKSFTLLVVWPFWFEKKWFIWHLLQHCWYAAEDADSRDLICIAEFLTRSILDIYIKHATTSFACICVQIYYLRNIKDIRILREQLTFSQNYKM